MILLLAMMAAAVESRDWTEGMFPQHYSTEDMTRLPAGRCRFILCPVNGLIVYSPGCEEVPAYPDLPIAESRLSLLGTGLEVLAAGDFSTWGQLTSLRIEMNMELKVIEPRVFYHLASLTNLSICNNYNLQNLDPDVFDGLVNLKELRFVKNNLKTLFHFSLAARPYILPSLVFLDLSENPIEKIAREDFVEMEDSPLEILKLKLCRLHSIEPDSFAGLRKLKHLNLGRNNLTPPVLIKLIDSLKTTSDIKRLGLASNLLNKNVHDLLQAVAATSISSLDISYNHFEMFTHQFFPHMPNLETLSLKEVSAIDVDVDTFSIYLLPNLKTLYFSGNRLPGFVPGLQLANLKELDLSENNCLGCPVTSLFKINENELRDMKLLEVLNLSKNNIFEISRFMFFGLESLRALYLSNCSIFRIEEYSFGDLSRLEHLDLSLNHFATSDKLDVLTFDGLISLTSLRLDSCYITSLNPDTFTHLTSLKYLTLVDNSIMEINPSLFLPLTQVLRVDLSSNVLLPWKSQLFYNNKELEVLSVASNHLYKLNKAMISDFGRIRVINMRDNPLRCDCELVLNVLEAESKSESIFGLNDSAVKCATPKKWSETRVMEFIHTNSFNYNCLHWSMYIFVLSACLLFILITCSVGIYYLRWYLRYWLFLFKQTWRSSFPGKRPDRAIGEYKYDAFISYSNEDRNFVIRLVAMMENYEPYFRLCVFERDFNAGEVICESVVDCLAVSKKTILILTDSFARSQWCQWELQMAHHKRFFFKSDSQDSLILIKLGDIMDAHMTPTLRYLMKTRIYLQWYPDPKRQRVFWQKLREALLSPGNNAINV